jgi:hypothetical protein
MADPQKITRTRDRKLTLAGGGAVIVLAAIVGAHPVSLATRIGERSMPRQAKRTRRLPQQIDLFAGEPRTTTGGAPAWSGLPTETQAALTD